MLANSFETFDPARVPSPCFVVDEAAIEANLRILADVQRRSGAKVLAALKAFSMFELGALTARYLSGACASGLIEAELAHEHYRGDGGELHVYAAAYASDDMPRILDIADHVVFNSLSQWTRFRGQAEEAQRRRPGLSFGLRVNPEHSEGEVALYDPCAPGSRLGATAATLQGNDLRGISGLHFHTLCEQGLPPLERTIAAFEERFADWLPGLSWVNFGGGHHITKADYDRDGLVRTIASFRERHGTTVYLEPGEAIAIHSGVLIGEVLDIFETDRRHAILNLSATCHMPDTLEMPYRADVLGSGQPGEKDHTYRLGGLSCLAGDVIGDYSFDEPLEVGQRLVFDDMAHYTMVKTTTFNGVRLPSIALWNSQNDQLRTLRDFGYADFKSRLG